MGTETNKDERNTPEYLAQLLKDKKQIQAFPSVFIHLEKLLDEEINRVRLALFHHKGNQREELVIPDGVGAVQTFSEKLYVPTKDHPEFNFVGRILGPRGMTAKELEQYTGCKIMVRGKGSMRDKKKEDQNKGKPNWEHLNDELHVLLTVEDTANRAEAKLKKAVEEVKKLLVPAPEGEDDLKKMQLMELAILNGTYRDQAKAMIPTLTLDGRMILTSPMGNPFAALNGQDPTKMNGQVDGGMLLSSQFGNPFAALNGGFTDPSKMNGHGHYPHSYFQRLSEAHRMIATTSPLTGVQQTMRSPGPAGAPLILAPRMQNIPTSSAGLIGGPPPPLVSPTDASGAASLIYNPYSDFPYGYSPAASIIEYPSHLDQTAAGAVPKIRRAVEGLRTHPYARVTLS
ncbi:KH domain-containing RNA-binding protein qki.L-like isoform X2 [Mytilus galloprovincialis]|uniref:KH domain-containing RNA-binding protein qki.L-like isoform X2 n=1 Tax=Mytilus galloprovincialis TaxID=29158 RepID=UPI003F7C53BE